MQLLVGLAMGWCFISPNQAQAYLNRKVHQGNNPVYIIYYMNHLFGKRRVYIKKYHQDT